MSTAWKVGDEARIATYGGVHWVLILNLSAHNRPIATTLSESGGIEYWSLGSLETRESYLAKCQNMQDDWTGAHYREMIELADRPFIKPPKWDEWLARATG